MLFLFPSIFPVFPLHWMFMFVAMATLYCVLQFYQSLRLHLLRQVGQHHGEGGGRMELRASAVAWSVALSEGSFRGHKAGNLFVFSLKTSKNCYKSHYYSLKCTNFAAILVTVWSDGRHKPQALPRSTTDHPQCTAHFPCTGTKLKHDIIYNILYQIT